MPWTSPSRARPIKWSYEPKPSQLAIGKACCDAVIRGWAYANGKLIYNLLDDHTIAVDAQTGKEVWRVKMGNVEKGETMTMAPFVVGNKVLVGNSGGEMGKIGWVAALDVDTGKELWRAFATGPDDLVKIGPDFKPFYPWLKGKDLGVSTWPNDMWKTGAGASWGWFSYDPDLNLVYIGTSNPGPRVPMQRPGLNLYTSSVIARDADTGMAKWAYAFTPHDQWDYDGVNENILIDLPINGKTRKVLVHLDRNAFAYTIDRVTGEVLVAEPFAYQTWSDGIDLKTGMPKVKPEMEPKPEVQLTVCPPDIGGKDWQPSAFSPRTGLVYAAIFNICMDLTDHVVSYIAGTPYDGMEMKRHPGPGGNWGQFMAWNPATGQKVWKIDEKFMTMSGVLATAGDVVFYGTVDGWFRAVDARSGKVLWSQKLGSGIIAQPMTFLGPGQAAVCGRLCRRRRCRHGEQGHAGLPAARLHALCILDRRRIARQRRGPHRDRSELAVRQDGTFADGAMSHATPMAIAVLLATSVLLGGCDWRWPWASPAHDEPLAGATASLVEHRERRRTSARRRSGRAADRGRAQHGQSPGRASRRPWRMGGGCSWP